MLVLIPAGESFLLTFMTSLWNIVRSGALPIIRRSVDDEEYSSKLPEWIYHVGKAVDSGAGVLFLSLGHMGFNMKEAHAYARSLKIEGCKEYISVCPFCAVCCQIVAYVKNGKLISTEGDPDFPINEGSLCAKGASLFSMYTHTEGRVMKPLYRAPYSDKWEEKDWDWTLDQIARRVKAERDKSFIQKNDKGQTVNRLETICWMGTSHASNEECAVIQEALKSLGIVSMDHQARV